MDFWLLLGCVCGLFSIPLTASIVYSQITPDGTVNTTVTTTGLNTTITNGTAAGANLFHSFQQFSIPTGGAATFDLVNTPTITTIFSRVTGGSISNIDGLIRTTNSANPVSLFLLNPAGILFGSNASLNIGGSFVGTTASSVKFADGTEFSATNPSATPVLTISVPIGLQMGENPAAIQVLGTGHTLTVSGLLAPVMPNNPPTGLVVSPGQTLALVGGDLGLQGGSLSAFGGRLELGAVKEAGFVNLTAVPQGWQLSYPTPQFGDIRLANTSLVDVSSTAGLSAGTIQLQGQNLSVRDGSILRSQNTGSQAAGSIRINTTQSIEMSGAAPDRTFNSQIRSESFAQGAGASIDIRTQRMRITDGAIVISFNFLDAPSSVLAITATESLETVGALPHSPLNRSGIYGISVSTKPSVALRLTAGRLAISSGAQIVSSAFGTGSGGIMSIAATEVNITGFEPITQVPSSLNTSSFGQGNAGSLVLNTQRLSLLNGGSVNVSAYASGNAGNVTVNATESATLSGGFVRRSGQFVPSSINSSALSATPVFRQVFSLSEFPAGSAGSVTLNTPALSVDNRAEIGVKAIGAGDGGTLLINVDRLLLNHGSALNATTASGRGGNIVVNVRDLLLLRQESNITATAGGSGNGGNITIAAPIVAGFENSDIIANAVQGRGGNIQINTQGIFGLQFRPQLTPENDITASSQFGVNGLVQVNTIGVDPSAGLVPLPGNLTDSSRQLTASCAGTQGNQFVITGRGGIPENPLQVVKRDRPWADLRDPIAFRSPTPPLPHSPTPPPLTEATTWQHNPDGGIELIVDRLAQIPQPATCARPGIN